LFKLPNQISTEINSKHLHTIYRRKMCVIVLISYQKCPHSQLVSVELKDSWCTKQNGAPYLTRWPPVTHTVRQATFQLHNDTTTKRIVLCQDKGCSLAYST